jgi:5-methylcytosine-specific restriction endonuclease McrA
MSTIEPFDPEPVEATERRRLTAAEKAAILARQGALCPRCAKTLIWAVVDGKPVFGPMIDEHVIPLQLGGSNDLSNRELWCVPCAKIKTKRDLKAIAKVQRIRRRAAGEEHPKQKIRSRGFPRDPLHWKNA